MQHKTDEAIETAAHHALSVKDYETAVQLAFTAEKLKTRRETTPEPPPIFPDL